MFKIGEHVEIKGTGAIGEVTRIDYECGVPVRLYVDGIPFSKKQVKRVTVSRALEEAHKMAKLEVGDSVVITGGDYHCFRQGEVCTVLLGPEGRGKYYLKGEREKQSVSPEHFVKKEEAHNVAGRYEKGDVVIITGGAYHDFENGEVCAIVSGPDRQGDYRMSNVKGIRQFVSPEHFVLKELEWLKLRAKENVSIDGYYLSKGAAISAKRINHDTYLLSFEEGHQQKVSESLVNKFFYRRGDEIMGAELYGYPPDLEKSNEPTVSEVEYRKKEEELAHTRAELRKLQEQKESERLARLDEEFGEVTERHLWKVEIYVKPSLGGFFRPNSRGGFFSGEVITSTTSVMEAAIAAETLAKRYNENARVDKIKYERDINAIK